jgi:RNA polymerase sigma-70 factor (ECF subfamily)
VALAARAGDDPDLFAVFFRRHVHDVHRFISRRTRNDMLADDLTAVTFERCWAALPGFEPTRSTLRPWLFRIAANAVASHYRSESRRRGRERLVTVRDEPLRSAPRPDDVAERVDTEVLDALAELAERHQEVLSLRFLADLTTGEAAAAMQIGARHFAVLQYRALRALRRALEGASDG